MNLLQKFFLLVVDDDPLIHQSIKLIVPPQWKVFSVQNPNDLNVDRMYHAAFVDMHLIPQSQEVLGPSVIEKLIKSNAMTDVIAMSGDIDRATMEQCLSVGACKFISKPLFPEEISPILEKIEALWALRNIDPSAKRDSANFIGKSAAAQLIRKRVAELRGELSPVLIEGETGTGKDVVARLLHAQESERPFIAVNLGSIPENLFESEMFGHIKGAFTGADQNKIGLVEAAHGGDLFLDEIEALPLSQQVKLLRFLETGEFRKVGSKENQFAQVRVIAASNQPLDQMVKAGNFREDLLYRINAQKINMPSLRERKEDIAQLAQYFLDSEKPRRNKKIADDGITALMNYEWPGNIRELKRVCSQLSLTSPLPIIRSEDVSRWLAPPLASPTSTTKISSDFPEISLEEGLSSLMENYEKMIIKQALNHYKDVDNAAQILKISRSNLYKKIKDYQIEGTS